MNENRSELTRKGSTPTGGRTASAGRNRTRRVRRRHHIVRNIILVFLSLGIIGLTSAAIFGYSALRGVKEIHPENIYDMLSQSSVLYDDDGNEIDMVFAEANRENVSINDIPKNLRNAFIALEDKTFQSHHGFNVIRMFGAVRNALFSGGNVSGTSTITQQLARNLYLPDTQMVHSYARKIQEAYYATELENALSKDEILEAYLNTIYFGYSSYGVETASESYFSKDVSELSLAQCAALAAIPQAPADFQLVEFIEGGNPDEYPDQVLHQTRDGIFIMNDLSKPRRETCLELMLEQGKISKAEYDEAVAVPLKDMLAPNYAVYDSSAAYFADYVIDEVIDKFEEGGMTHDEAVDKVYNGGVRIYTTLDSQAQSVVMQEFADPDNYPYANPYYDGNGNILDDDGNLRLYAYSNYFDENGNFVLTSDEAHLQDDGSLLIGYDHRLNIYDTTLPDGSTDYSLEFKGIYTTDDADNLYYISGGYILIPQKYKSRNDAGDLIISADFFKDESYKDFFIFNEDGTIFIPSSSYSLNQRLIQPQAAMTIVENSTGHIKAMVGGRNTSGRMIYNRAINPRQPGSSIKPLAVYSAALQESADEAAAGQKHEFVNYGIDKQGDKLWGDYLTAASIVIDEKCTVSGKEWPSNFSRSFSGPQTLRSGFYKSLNTCSVKVWYQVGADYSLNNLKKFGISTVDDDSDRNAGALAVGGMTHGVTSLDMASAFTVFPNLGYRYDTTAFTKVTDADGNLLLESTPTKHDVIDPGVSWIMCDIMEDVVELGYATGAQVYDTFTAGKTGTSEHSNDIWFDGFTPNYTASLWIGNDYGIGLDANSSTASAMWGRIMNQVDGAHGGSKPDRPDNVIWSGNDYFIAGTETGQVSMNDLTKKVLICKDCGYLATPDCKNVVEMSFYTYGYREGEEDGQEGPVSFGGASSDGQYNEQPPKYYCYMHNKDVNKYPISPKEKLVEPKEEKPKDPGKDDNKNPGDGTGDDGGTNPGGGTGDGGGTNPGGGTGDDGGTNPGGGDANP